MRESRRGVYKNSWSYFPDSVSQNIKVETTKKKGGGERRRWMWTMYIV
jgi:hypothetical protein